MTARPQSPIPYSSPGSPSLFHVSYELGEDGDEIDRVVLIRPGSVTHHFDFEQRYVPLSFVANPGTNTLTVTAPFDPDVAPRGYWMLFLVSQRGIPSVAPFVQLQ